jgi:hypothetical protein
MSIYDLTSPSGCGHVIIVRFQIGLHLGGLGSPGLGLLPLRTREEKAK